MSIKKTNCTACTNGPCLIKQHFSGKHFWQKKVTEIFVKRNKDIIHAGTVSDRNIYFIKSGAFKIYTSVGKKEKTMILRFAKAGDILGDIFSLDEILPIGTQSIEDSVVCTIENKFVNDLLKINPEFTMALIRYYTREMQKVDKRLIIDRQKHTTIKLAKALLLMLESFGVNKRGVLNITLSRKDIAALTGTSYEEVSRKLSTFEKQGLIGKVDKKIALLNIDELNKISNNHADNKKK